MNQAEQIKGSKQKEAIYNLALEAIAASGAQPNGSPLKSLITKDVRKAIRAKLFEGIKTGTIQYKPKKADGDVKKYCSSVINNWLKKDKRYN
jgi:hypothetical protein